MAVFKRKSKNGKETAEYHYKFMYRKAFYYGVCEGCTTKREAEAYEKQKKDLAKEASEAQSDRDLIDRVRRRKKGKEAVTLENAYSIANEIPRKKESADRQKMYKESVFSDFVAFMSAKVPQIKLLNDVEPEHAQMYMTYLRENGRFTKKIYIRHGKEVIEQSHAKKLSVRTCNGYLQVLKEIFAVLAEQAGLYDNPFEKVAKQVHKGEKETREAFSITELKRIYEGFSSHRFGAFCKPLFMVALHTGMREGDICSLKWENINFEECKIVRKMNKTQHTIVVPMLRSLFDYLLEVKDTADNDSEYVFPEHYKMYSENPSGISYRVKDFLEGCEIENATVEIEGRSHKLSKKDLHSCRHTFCYLAGANNMPLAVVQSIVGHMTPELTALYSAHFTTEDKRKHMQKLETVLDFGDVIDTVAIEMPSNKALQKPLRQRLYDLLSQIPESRLNEAESLLKGLI